MNGDVIACVLTSSASCLTTTTANSNTIAVIVHPSLTPSVTVDADATTICSGDPVSLKATIDDRFESPVYQWQVNGMAVGGNVAEFQSRNFQDGDIVLRQVTGNAGCAVGNSSGIVMTVNPTAKTTLYTLTVTSPEGSAVSAQIKVSVFRRLRIPNAFTPNGDGKNDIFYVLGGPLGSTIKDLCVYDRWGQKISQVHDALPADPGFGWNGTFGGAPVAPGTYVYSLVMRFADGSQQVLQGTCGVGEVVLGISTYIYLYCCGKLPYFEYDCCFETR